MMRFAPPSTKTEAERFEADVIIAKAGRTPMAAPRLWILRAAASGIAVAEGRGVMMAGRRRGAEAAATRRLERPRARCMPPSCDIPLFVACSRVKNLTLEPCNY